MAHLPIKDTKARQAAYDRRKKDSAEAAAAVDRRQRCVRDPGPVTSETIAEGVELFQAKGGVIERLNIGCVSKASRLRKLGDAT